jgi:hypothetical protein
MGRSSREATNARDKRLRRARVAFRFLAARAAAAALMCFFAAAFFERAAGNAAGESSPATKTTMKQWIGILLLLTFSY